MKLAVPTLLLFALLCSCDPATETVSETPEVTTSDPTENRAQLVDIDSDEARIATALLAAPAASRDGAKVIGYNAAGEFVTLREGTNEFICLADDPNKDGFNAACYHQSLEPFMMRGRELQAEGKSAQEIFALREEEVKSGKLTMGDAGSTLHVYSGPNATYDPETGKVDGASYRYVVYMPYATAASTGLPESPIAPNHPWIMDPGTHRAHIMISPLKGED
ncbi:hypothetical protein GGR28_002244 [Lewinella aquimaris]|uniref:Uncharacterized protein n=1 Tax=Neolewinella aquimaris TaxID=1835722 RepID=A0A840ECU3_9BACT|nr:hypothetical protein [Neolewinella aquimaris]MBB4079619.1 hypothetical protein [Neolewinella aquimaris]